jgi:hypothetical protein
VSNLLASSITTSLTWRTVSCVGNTVISSAGSLISFFLGDYIAAGKGYNDIVHLITIPTLSMVSAIGGCTYLPCGSLNVAIYHRASVT